MKAVLLAGGLGTRLREETEYKPKPMVEIGEMPILWHIMKNLSVQDLRTFIICLGYKGNQIRDFFINYGSRVGDVRVRLGQEMSLENLGSHAEDWEVTLSDTGQTTMTGGRLYRVREHLGNETFLCTYGDGLADIDLSQLLDFHKSHGRIATVTAVRPETRFGSLGLDGDRVSEFLEKPKTEKWVSGGFFLFEPAVFNYLDEDCILEQGPLQKLASEGELFAYRHHGFWQPMDTFRETQMLNEMWMQRQAPWCNWTEGK